MTLPATEGSFGGGGVSWSRTSTSAGSEADATRVGAAASAAAIATARFISRVHWLPASFRRVGRRDLLPSSKSLNPNDAPSGVASFLRRFDRNRELLRAGNRQVFGLVGA